VFNPSYLMLSRHNVYYFRWPIPKLHHDSKLEYVRLSLATRKPREALRRAKVLEYHAMRIIRAYGGSLMNNAEAKAIITEYFQTILQRRKDKITENGPLSDERRANVRRVLQQAEDWIELVQNGAELEEDDTIKKINNVMGLQIDPSSADAEKLKANYNLAEPAMIKEWLRFNDEQKDFNFAPQKEHLEGRKIAKRDTLDQACQEFVNMRMSEGEWDNNTKEEKEAYLAVLKEILGKNFDITQIDAEKAREIRAIIVRIPVNRNKDKATKNISLMAAIEAKGLKPIAPATVNKYINCYKAFFAWCVLHDYIYKNPFLGMRGKASAQKPEDRRKAFTKEQIKTMLEELETRKIAKKDYAYWGTLIGIYTGARLNEVSQIMLDDIKQEDGIWYFDMNDEGDGKKLKNEASRRRVPIHQALLDIGLVEYRDALKKQGKPRLLYELTFCKKNGYGKKLGNFFNGKFLKALEMKSKQAVFHSLRHTVVTRLVQADQDEKKIKSIIGHTQSGTAMKTYFAENYKLKDLKEVLDKLHA
jgi:integrase